MRSAHRLHPGERSLRPCRKVNYSVESARLGQMTDYEKLMIEVWTNRANHAE